MKRFFTQRKLNILISALAVAVMWAVWIIAYYAVGNDYIIPSFRDTFLSVFEECLFKSGFWISFLNTLLRTLCAFAVSFAIASLLAVSRI